jgi:putative PIN family toxin of toxin-antitoxin system
VVARVIIDANIFISYALSPNGSSAIVQAVESIWIEPIQLILPEILISEVRSAVERKPHLRERIPIQDLEDLIEALQAIAIPLYQDRPEIAQVLRDRRDDYLLDAAVHADVDCLVTGDRDLLDIRDQVYRPKIVTVREFLDLFEQMAE